MLRSGSPSASAASCRTMQCCASSCVFMCVCVCVCVFSETKLKGRLETDPKQKKIGRREQETDLEHGRQRGDRARVLHLAKHVADLVLEQRRLAPGLRVLECMKFRGSSRRLALGSKKGFGVKCWGSSKISCLSSADSHLG